MTQPDPDPTNRALSADEELTIPAVTLVFSIDAEEWHADEEPDLVLLDAAEHAYEAITDAEPRFNILKSFTFYAGKPWESQAEEIRRLSQELTAAREEREKVLGRHDYDGESWPYSKCKLCGADGMDWRHVQGHISRVAAAALTEPCDKENG